MNNHCKEDGCESPRRPRHDRPGKFFTLCDEHYAAYMSIQNKAYYLRNQEAQKKRAKKYRDDNPETVKAAWQEYNSRPEVIARKKAFMKTYRRPWRQYVKDHCERCPYVSQHEELKDMDVHHLDENKQNNDPSNLQTLCATCHRLVEHTPGRCK